MDRFQAVNDHYGHSVGDKLMVRLGVKLQQTVRSVDTVARFGSDEFGVLARDLNLFLDRIGKLLSELDAVIQRVVAVNGDIVAIAGLKDVTTGDTLSDPG